MKKRFIGPKGIKYRVENSPEGRIEAIKKDIPVTFEISNKNPNIKRPFHTDDNFAKK